MRIYLDMCCYNRPYDPQEQLTVAMETQSKLHILILREKLDYTRWRKTYYDAMKPGAFHEKALAYAKEHPYTGNAQVI